VILVDTNVWSELTKKQPSENVRRWEAGNATRLWLSAIVLAEFRAGVVLMPEGRKRTALETQIEAIVDVYQDRLLPFDERVTPYYGRVLLSARRSGKPIMAADAMIAATALAHDMRVATRDANDFAGAGVELINPWTA
jgi:predicted nucleic acid-binding protein